ncbi:hypothetical protein ACUNE0_25775, partial [Serratia sp. IR-2025]
SIHSDGSFEGLGCVLANTNLNVLTAVFYWFTLKRDEPKKSPQVCGQKFLVTSSFASASLGGNA